MNNAVVQGRDQLVVTGVVVDGEVEGVGGGVGVAAAVVAGVGPVEAGAPVAGPNPLPKPKPVAGKPLRRRRPPKGLKYPEPEP
jgi:hypothetical protein